MTTPRRLSKPLQQPPCLLDCLLNSTAVGLPAASSPHDGARLERLSTPHLMAAAENELHQVERLGGAAAIHPRQLAERLVEDEEAERLVSSELLSELSELSTRQRLQGSLEGYQQEEYPSVTSRTRPHRSALAQLSGLSGLSQLSGLSELSGLASSQSSELSGRTMEHATGQDAALGGRSSFLGGLHVYSGPTPEARTISVPLRLIPTPSSSRTRAAPQRRPEGAGYPSERAVASLALDANDEALIAEIAEMARGE